MRVPKVNAKVNITPSKPYYIISVALSHNRYKTFCRTKRRKSVRMNKQLFWTLRSENVYVKRIVLSN